MFWQKHFIAMLAGCTLACSAARAEEAVSQIAKKGAEKIAARSRRKEPVFDLARLKPEIVVELRYATARNLAKRAIYPPDARCLVRESVAGRLLVAQTWLEQHAPEGTKLKIWDGYRPATAQRLLWKVLPDKEYLGDPKRLGSLHTWGACVDATLCDAQGRDLKMPTDFDVLTPEARSSYTGEDEDVKRNLGWLQGAMAVGGFLVVRDEWWHFVARDFAAYAPLDVPLALPRKR
jgi:D-alanyl-D-alanine dipeptidase